MGRELMAPNTGAGDHVERRRDRRVLLDLLTPPLQDRGDARQRQGGVRGAHIRGWGSGLGNSGY